MLELSSPDNLIYSMFNRGSIQAVNEKKSIVGKDYAYAKYSGEVSFYAELSRMINDIARTGKTITFEGIELDINTQGGQLGLSTTQDRLLQARDTFVGLADLGLNNEKKLWQFN